MLRGIFSFSVLGHLSVSWYSNQANDLKFYPLISRDIIVDFSKLAQTINLNSWKCPTTACSLPLSQQFSGTLLTRFLLCKPVPRS
ncbi:uncharacterized protein EV420DRAFT_234849 [Desarmillaria tabescens]|uniref:Uncharacterized protein n=1 Tax=Armillaria tabescens TaxID=1929756 RepID=A0AA39J9T1_ARMTA|nr:uncharacterized protein EV420DRAFT_234849 [Desarmillaria tabescens]KAK0436798.1 hypothetical protein EV420DRAFT_234849 [Desarmillaria tabescens]